MKERIYDPAHPITEPGLYVMTEEQYHADPCATPSASASILKRALPLGAGYGTARHMWHNHPRLNPPDPEAEDEGKKSFDLGSAFHALILGKGAELVVIEAKDYRTSAAKEAREAAYKAGKQPVLKEQYERALKMRSAAVGQIRIRKELASAMNNGRPERVLIWIEETQGGPVMCRAQLDWIPDKGEAFPDWKTTATGAGPEAYGRTFFNLGADIQDAFYRRGIKAVLGRDAHLIFPVIEVAEPHCMMVHRASLGAHHWAARKVQWALNLFGLCLHEGVWPGYPVETAWQELPNWAETLWTDREDQGLASTDFNRSMIEMAKQMERHQHTYDPAFAADFDLPEHGASNDR